VSNHTPKDILKSALAQFFLDRFYEEGVQGLRIAIRSVDYYNKNWSSVILQVLNQSPEIGDPFDLVCQFTNIPLEENTNAEAYKWLVLMLINASGAEGDPIVEY
jgi:hypothetical protein